MAFFKIPRPSAATYQNSYVLEAETGHFGVTGYDAKFRLTDAEVATIASSANTKIDALALEISKRIEEIAKTKLPDLNTTNLESAMRTIEGTARQMGLTVE